MLTFSCFRLWRGQVRNQSARFLTLRRHVRDASREHGHSLDLWRQRTDDLDAGDVQQFAELLKAEVRVLPRHDLAHRHARRRLDGALRNQFGDAPSLPELLEMIAARSGGVENPRSSQDRLLARALVADAGPQRARRNRHSDTRARETHAASRDEMA